MSRHDDSVRLRHMLDAARKARSLARRRKRKELDTDETLALALVKLVEIIGEAANRVSDEFQNSLPDLPWAEMIAMRNRLIHDYANIDNDQVWTTVNRDLPELVRLLEKAVERSG